jgi:lipoprotein-anchoring transpeptidase ErfK/SrfK
VSRLLSLLVMMFFYSFSSLPAAAFDVARLHLYIDSESGFATLYDGEVQIARYAVVLPKQHELTRMQAAVPAGGKMVWGSLETIRYKPIWRPTANMHEERRKRGLEPLKTAYRYGDPGHPLGTVALNINWDLPSIEWQFSRLHGNAQHNNVGENESAGCFRFFNEDIETIARFAELQNRQLTVQVRLP